MTAKLSAEELTVIRGERCLFEDVAFALNPGELLLLEGRNGSGKTSLLRAIAGLIELERGRILWDAVPVSDDRQTFHDQIVWMAHRVGFKADLTLLENLGFEAALRRQSNFELTELLARLDIQRFKNLPMRSLSAGQRRRVALARVLMSDATLWMLDEPVTNLDREGRSLVMLAVSEHVSRGGMVIMSTHQDVDVDVPLQKITLQ